MGVFHYILTFYKPKLMIVKIIITQVASLFPTSMIHVKKLSRTMQLYTGQRNVYLHKSSTTTHMSIQYKVQLYWKALTILPDVNKGLNAKYGRQW